MIPPLMLMHTQVCRVWAGTCGTFLPDDVPYGEEGRALLHINTEDDLIGQQPKTNNGLRTSLTKILS